jgi:hypothetical protein
MLRLTAEWQRENVDTVTNKRRFCASHEKFKVIWKLENGETKAGVHREFDVANSTI